MTINDEKSAATHARVLGCRAGEERDRRECRTWSTTDGGAGCDHLRPSNPELCLIQGASKMLLMLLGQ